MMTTTTARKPTQRALADWRTTWAARSGVSSKRRMGGAEVNRSVSETTGTDASAGTGRRCSGSEPGAASGVVPGSVGWSVLSDAARRRTRRDDARLPDGDGQGAEGDLAGVDGQHAAAVHADPEAVHAPRRRAVLGALGLDAQPVVARPVAGALHPEVLEARVRLAAQVRAALVQRADVQRGPIAGRVLARDEALLDGSTSITNERAKAKYAGKPS